MSWKKDQFNKAYDRAKSLRFTNKDHEDEANSRWHSDFYQRDDFTEMMRPTLKEVAVGKLLSALTKLGMKRAKELLDLWYW